MCRRKRINREEYEAEHKQEDQVLKDEIWQYMDDNNNWRTYDYEQLIKLQSLKIGVEFKFLVGSQKYSFKKLTEKIGIQQNLKSRKQRECRKINVRDLRRALSMENVVSISDVESDNGYYEEQTCLIQ